MMTEPLLEQLAVWAAHPTTGINALLSAGPWAVAPPPVQVITELTDVDLARRHFDEQRAVTGPFFALLIGDARWSGTSLFAGGDELRLVALYLDARRDPLVMQQSALRTMRAARRVLATQWAALGNTGLVVPGGTIEAPTQLDLGAADVSLGVAQAVLALSMLFPSIDHWAHGAPLGD